MSPSAASRERAGRVLRRIEALARLSDAPERLTRLFLSPAHARANGAVAEWMDEAGMQARTDPAGNLVGRYEGAAPGAASVMIGSHLDTVRNAGRYDGTLGVLVGIETVDALHRAGRRLPASVEVVAFGDEEGVRFGTTVLGSRAMAGGFREDDLAIRDTDGTSLDVALSAFGLDPGRVGEASRADRPPAAYLELHIEQGPVLEEVDRPLAAVSAIAGSERWHVEIGGRPGHAGTVPMELRRDALTAAAECILAVERLALEREIVGTVGELLADPGASNVVPGRVRLSVDLRSSDDARLGAAGEALRRVFVRTGRARGVDVTVRALSAASAVRLDPRLTDHVEAAVRQVAGACPVLPSGAGHDAAAMDAICPAGMLFVRCKGGVSHAPEEDVGPEDIAVAIGTMEVLIDRVACDAAGSESGGRRPGRA